MPALTRNDAVQMLNKAPEVTLYFWIIKILATTVGETGADFLSVKLGFGLNGTSVVMGSLLAAVLLVHLRARRYVPWLYWVTVVLMSVVGTLITDKLTDKLGVSLFVSTAAMFGTAIAAAYYGLKANAILALWAAYVLTRPLGAPIGDLLSQHQADGGLGLGTMGTSVLFLTVITALVVFMTLRANGSATQPEMAGE